MLTRAHRAGVDNALVEYEKRTFEQEMAYIEKVSNCCYKIKKGFVPNMRVRVLMASSLLPDCRPGRGHVLRQLAPGGADV